MRILGFSKKWYKLHIGVPIEQRPDFTTFRLKRRDRDWQINEQAQIVFKPRSKEREVLGIAEITSKEQRNVAPDWGQVGLPMITNDEAIEDGFANWAEMFDWLGKAHGLHRLANEPINKLTLRWLFKGE